VNTNRPPFEPARQGDLYRQVRAEYQEAIGRLARAYEANPEQCADLIQEIHIAIWRSLKNFDGRCALRTWVYRVAHNTAASHVTRAFRFKRHLVVTLDELATSPEATDPQPEDAAGHDHALERVLLLIHRLEPIDRQVMVCYLEGLDGSAISEIVGISTAAVAMKIHRAKTLLARQFHEGV
jgi:RNA polymerase sigma-70 factor, ECF subfamily